MFQNQASFHDGHSCFKMVLPVDTEVTHSALFGKISYFIKVEESQEFLYALGKKEPGTNIHVDTTAPMGTMLGITAVASLFFTQF